MADAKTSASTTAGQLKMLRQAKESLLKEWDISFGMNGEIMLNIMGFMNDINTEIPIKFYSDRIFMHQKSPDNIQYAEIEISSQDVSDYKPNLEGDPKRKDAKSIFNGSDGIFKGVLVDMKGTVEEIQSFAQKDDIIMVRIDTSYYKRIEFHCPGNVVIWAQLLEPTTLIKALEKLPEMIRKVRNNPDIKKASVILEPQTFNRILNIGGKGGGKKRDVDERIFIELDKKDGLFISSGDRLKGRFFALKPVDIVSQLGDFGEGGFSNVNIPEGTYEGEVIEGMDEIDMLSPSVGDMDIGDNTDIGNNIDPGPVETGMVDTSDELEVPDFAPSSYQPERREEKKLESKPENRAQVDQVLGMEVDSAQFIYMQQEFLGPFSKLKGLSPISIEIRTEKPIIIEQAPFNGIKALLSIAPRIENEEDR